MATIPRSFGRRQVEYPTSDGKPMAETDVHRDLLTDLIETLKRHFETDPQVYVSGNLILCYQEGDKRIHVAPDVLVTRGISKLPRRPNYLLWEEGKPPDVVIELTSKSTRQEDEDTKFALYRDTIQVPEYFLFDPYEEYLRPSMRGYRLVEGEYLSIEPVDGRLPSESLGLELERDGTELRLVDPATGRRLLTPREYGEAAAAKAEAAEVKAEAAEVKAEAAEVKAEVAEAKAVEAKAESEAAEAKAEVAETKAEVAETKAEAAKAEAVEAKAEAARLRAELEALKLRLGDAP